MAKTLTPEQYIAIEWLSIPGKGGKTYEEIADICGVHFNTLGNWRKDKAFDAELKRAIVRNNSAKLPEVVESMADWAIREGNAAAAKLVLQINGMLTDKLEVETKLDSGTDVAALTARIKALQVRKGDEDSADSQG
ncbi:phBC6A51 family helix-turn-helix protein [Paenibacillus sp. FSL R5-0928]|uniref:phBC6A51 family helix-turn-helix protein n=1 Tax=unclassified Paenibacillus TaxID=185978 RepID=UPI0030DCFEC1